tara:strand:- start:679 stop:1170 length:492 start_codon:yes stop_codon:yes gene_type:complete
MSSKACPCGSNNTFAECCQPLLRGEQKANSPEQLMRSRYSAFYVGEIKHLLKTHHLSQHSKTQEQDLIRTVANTRWLGLTILSTEGGTSEADQGQVEFLARYKVMQEIALLHEKSRFVREKGQWFYVDGTIDPRGSAPMSTPGRNELCWCNSGLKFKLCHCIL